MIHSELRVRLPELLLMRVDKISMSVSLEGRVPFLDHALVDFTMDIPMADKVRGNEPKRLLKRAVEGWIPHEIIYRKKMGFGAPMAQWMRGDFGERVEREVLASPLMQRGWFESDFVRTLCAEHRAGRRDNSLHIWTLFNLTAWYDYWVAPTRH
jgi:asparagine synthase (glutamine-hydrolysing)